VRILSTSGAVTGSLGSLTGPAPTSAPSSSTNPAIVTTASGLQYIDLKVGTGTVAAVNKNLSVHYVGTLLDGTKFDSSRDRGTPFSFKLGTGAVIKGWDEGLLGLKVGSIRQLIIPTNLAYGTAGSGTIPPNATIVFDVELLGVT
jgi:peptidylprolyl isomerase